MQIYFFQEHGLLSEPKEDDHESYFAHCKLHSDSETTKRRKLSFLTYSLQYKVGGSFYFSKKAFEASYFFRCNQTKYII